MGLDPSVSFWYGIKIDYDDDEIQFALSEQLERRSQGSPWEWQEDGVTLGTISPGDGVENVGFGAVLYYTDWDETPTFEEMSDKIVAEHERVKEVVNRILDQYAPDKERNIYMQTMLW